ncbi:MAG: pilus assembly protein PilZ [Solidesulfovibrio sp.]
MAFDILRKKKNDAVEEQTRRRNAGILDFAIVQRSKIYIKFIEDITNITGITGTILAMNNAGLVLELSGIGALTDNFFRQQISCFFKIIEREGKHREIFYTFTATILRIRELPDKNIQIVVSFPDSIQGTQRRKSLRMRPDLNQFSHVALWRYEASGGFDMAKPTISYQHFKNSAARFENISAGGLRFVIRRALIKEQDLDVHKGDRFILFFTFSEEMSKLRSEYWLVAKVNNVLIDRVSGDGTIGMEYIANGVRKEDSSKVEWSKITDNVIDDMAQRIYQWHLTLYREKGLS